MNKTYRVHNTLHDTYPLIVHNPYLSEKAPYWDAIAAGPRPATLDLPADVTLVTWNNREKPGLLETQLAAAGTPYRCLGRGKKWTTNRVKLTTLLDELASIPTKYVLGADCYDVIVVAGLADIVARFEKKGARVVYNAATWLFPAIPEHGPVEDAICPHPPFCYLNGGLFLGETEFLKGFVAKILSGLPDAHKHPTSEQYLVKLGYHVAGGDVQVDWNCDLFQIIHLPRAHKLDIRSYVELVETPPPTAGH